MEPHEQNRCISGPGWHMSIGGDPIELTAFGKTYRFEWHNYCGPMFVTKRGNELRSTPGERNPWWKGFDVWSRQGKRTKDGKCVWEAGTPCVECSGKGHVPGVGGLKGLRSLCHPCHGEGVIYPVPTTPRKFPPRRKRGEKLELVIETYADA